jgi:LPS sulfotransferase NodH
VLIAGAGRSGSTLLEMMLDQVPGLVAVGELTDIWDAGLVRDERCGCGEQFARCPFWSAVGRRAFGGWDNVDAERMLADHDAVARNRQLPRLLTARWQPRFRARLDDYARALSSVYDAIAATTGCRVIVDASKWPSHAMALRRIEGLDLRMLHLVRDPRGVAHSWARELGRPQAAGSSEVDRSEMRRDQPALAALHWTSLNLGVEIVASLGVPRLLVFYDRLISAPRETLAEALTFAGGEVTAESLAFVGDDAVRLSAGHGIAGNPSRFGHGEVRLRAGDEWMTEMTRPTRLAVDALTFPAHAVYRWRRSRLAVSPGGGRR